MMTVAPSVAGYPNAYGSVNTGAQGIWYGEPNPNAPRYNPQPLPRPLPWPGQFGPRVPELSTDAYMSVIREADGNQRRGGILGIFQGNQQDGAVDYTELQKYQQQLQANIERQQRYRDGGGLFGKLLYNPEKLAQLEQKQQAARIMMDHYAQFNRAGDWNGNSISQADVAQVAARDGRGWNVSNGDLGRGGFPTFPHWGWNAPQPPVYY